MRTHETMLQSPARGWLVASVMAALFVLMGASGDDVFARHVGMSASTSHAPGTAAGVDGPAVTEDTRPATGEVLPVLRDHSSDDGGGAAHTLHLLGACLAVLGAGVALLSLGGLWRGCARATAAPSLLLTCPASWLARVLRGPPPRDPPRLSPVIRT